MQKLPTKIENGRREELLTTVKPWRSRPRWPPEEKQDLEIQISKWKEKTKKKKTLFDERGVVTPPPKTERSLIPVALKTSAKLRVGKGKVNKVKSPVAYSAKGKCVCVRLCVYVRVDIPIFRQLASTSTYLTQLWVDMQYSVVQVYPWIFLSVSPFPKAQTLSSNN